MTMGLSPVQLDAVNVTYDHVMKVRGENFTRYSVVHMGDEKMDTLYLDPETLVVPEAAPEDGRPESAPVPALPLSPPAPSPEPSPEPGLPGSVLALTVTTNDVVS